jgi:hypothetical protein
VGKTKVKPKQRIEIGDPITWQIRYEYK